MNTKEFVKLYPISATQELVERFGISRATVARKAKQLGLQKTPEYISKIQSERTKNRVFSPEAKAKIGAAAKGRKMTEETKAKVLQTKLERGTLLKGEKHYNWKGGKPWERFKEPLYQDWRNAVLKRDNYTCQDCQAIKKKNDRGLTAHHIKPYSQYPELRYEISNGITLCRPCHMMRHGKSLAPVERILCACGCGTMIAAIDPYHKRPRRFANHHYRRYL